MDFYYSHYYYDCYYYYHHHHHYYYYYGSGILWNTVKYYGILLLLLLLRLLLLIPRLLLLLRLCPAGAIHPSRYPIPLGGRQCQAREGIRAAPYRVSDGRDPHLRLGGTNVGDAERTGGAGAGNGRLSGITSTSTSTSTTNHHTTPTTPPPPTPNPPSWPRGARRRILPAHPPGLLRRRIGVVCCNAMRARVSTTLPNSIESVSKAFLGLRI